MIDLGQIPIAISLISLSAAIVKQTFDKKNGNRKYVRRDDCHSAMDNVGQRIDDTKESLHKRIDDICGKIDTVVTLIKNGRK